MYNATVREPAWSAFVNATPQCAGANPMDTFGCLQSADLSTLVSSLDKTLGIGSQEFPFPPVIDGPGGLIPDLPSTLISQGKFSHVSFIAGTVLDEGNHPTQRAHEPRRSIMSYRNNLRIHRLRRYYRHRSCQSPFRARRTICGRRSSTQFFTGRPGAIATVSRQPRSWLSVWHRQQHVRF